MRTGFESSHASWRNLHRIRGSDRRDPLFVAGDVRPLNLACCPRIYSHLNENRSAPRSVHRMWDARQRVNARPECHLIALRLEHPLFPDPWEKTPGLFQELNPLPQNFERHRCWRFPSIRRRLRARFHPIDS
jgi:hypothetical protein